MKYKLSIFIPTKNRKKKFKYLFDMVSSCIANYDNVQLVCGVQDDYIDEVSCNTKNIKILDSRKYIDSASTYRTRLNNYIHGISACDGEYTIILEDDDIISFDVIRKFLYHPSYSELCIYDIINPELSHNCEKIYSSEDFIIDFPRIFHGNFQWGQCITNTKYLRSSLNILDSLYINDFVQADEFCTLLCAKYIKNVCLFHDKLLYVGIGEDNYSWGCEKEFEQSNMYKDLLCKYICNNEEWLHNMIYPYMKEKV